MFLPALAATLCVACIGAIDDDTGTSGDPEGSTLGRASFALQLETPVELTQVTYTISRGEAVVRTGMLDLDAGDGTLRGLFLLPPADDYQLLLSARRADATECHGSTPFAITRGHTSQIEVVLTCTVATEHVGGGDLLGTFNACPLPARLPTQGISACVGEALALHAVTASDDDGPEPLVFMWTSTSGSFTVPDALDTAFTCTSAGSATLTLSTFDGDPICPAARSQLVIECEPSTACAPSTSADEPDAG